MPPTDHPTASCEGSLCLPTEQKEAQKARKRACVVKTRGSWVSEAWDQLSQMGQGHSILGLISSLKNKEFEL